MDFQKVRRLVHISAPLFCVYYLLPEELLPGLSRDQGVLFVMLFALGFESLRLIFQIKVPGMRQYEFERPSAAAWTAVGMTFALLLFPVELTLPVFMGMGWVDPIIGEMRKRGSDLYPVIPVAIYAALMVAGLGYFYGITPMVLVASTLIAPLAVFVESVRVRYIDDDIVLIVVPLLFLGMVFGQLPF